MRLLLALVVLIGGREIAAGLLAYQEGRFEQAYEAFTAAVERAGDSAPAELLYDQALTAARLRNWVEMEAAAERAAAQGGAGFAARRDFLRGNAAFDRSPAAADRAPIGNASDWDQAIVLGEAARRSWQAAATTPPGPPPGPPHPPP
nr:hypothetical protein [Planctomycetota bacterium]